MTARPVSSNLRTLMHEGVELESITRRLWITRRRTILLVVGPALAALVLGLLLPKWYRSGATFTVDAGQSIPNVSPSFAGLATQLGLGSAGSSSSPQFYAELLQSRNLQERILGAPLPLGPNNELRTLDQQWAPSDAVSAKTHAAALAKLKRHFSVSPDPRTGIISFSLEGPSPHLAKLMADTAMAALNDIVVAIRRKRAAAERTFLDQRWTDLRDSLTARENTLRRFYERNRQLTSPELQFEDLRLRREVERVQSVYADIGLRLEQARIQEVRDIPAISPIDAPIAPTRKASPKFSVLVVVGALLGFVAAVVITLFELAAHRVRAA
jgi:uncharacterized protein involved in exopolysaccharide biosynthesis